MPEKDQKMRFTKAELSLIRNTFGENEPLLYAVRKFLFGFEMTEGEQRLIDTHVKGAVYEVIKKTFMPELDPNAPLFQMVDMVNGLSIDFKERGEEQAHNFIAAKAVEMAYISQQINLLGGSKLSDGELITLKELANLSDESAYVNIIARNYLLSYIDSYTNELKFLSQMKEGETHEEALERIKKNSTK